jgi:L-threonylcarbamoyladenylate synthase
MNVMTSTNTHNSRMAAPDVQRAVKTISSGGLVLFPTDTIWTIGCDMWDPAACKSMLRLKSKPSAYSFEVLVDSLNMFKKFVPSLHPKLETLLFYHNRPLSILVPPPHAFPRHVFGRESSFAVRLVRDEYSLQLIQALGKPLFSTFATLNDQHIPGTFGSVSSSVLEKMDYVAKYKQSDKNQGQPAVVVSLSENDELVFLKE